MKRPQTSTPKPAETVSDSLSRLDDRLAAFETRRKAAPPGLLGDARAGYRVVGQLLSGILGGIGLGWLVDHFAHTSPWGLVLGLFIGAALSIYATVRGASLPGPPKTSAQGSAQPVPDDDNDEDD